MNRRPRQGTIRLKDPISGNWIGALALVSVLVVLIAACTESPDAGSVAPVASSLASAGGGGSAEKFLVVDCLLPGQIRRLGQEVTYVTPRRPTRTTAGDCEIRGGEYVAADRADYRTALQTWLKDAEAGDAKAQTMVGEIYERGLGTAPDYSQAATWYRRAADQGYAAAQVNLGALYEKGLGVEKDQARAAELYRLASGLPLGVSFAVADSDPEIERLKAALAAQQHRTEALSAELLAVRRKLEETERNLGEARKRAAVERTDLDGTESQLAARQATLAREREQLAADRERLRQQEVEIARLAAEQRKATGAAGAAEQPRAVELERQAAAARAEAERLRLDLARQQQAIGSRESEVASLKKSVSAKEAQIDQLNKEVARLEQEAASREKQLEKARAAKPTTSTPTSGTTVARTEPIIRMIDPLFPAVRGEEAPVITLRGALPRRKIIGQVIAPAGLRGLTINDAAAPVDDKNIFESDIDVAMTGTPVTIVAIDRVGARASLEFTLKPGGQLGRATSSGGPPAPVIPSPAQLDYGTYYALVIGNEAYARLPQLKTPVADARAIAAVLEKDYGFKVTTLTNATRYDILSALNTLRGKLTEKDNLLIYYAGHGTLDKINQRGYWQPIDAEPDSTANWIAARDISDVLNTMSARHILVIADSCYSGALTRAAVPRLDAGMSAEARYNWLKSLLSTHSRTALTSGGLQPVIDDVGGTHSVFGQALIDALTQKTGDGVVEGLRLYKEVAAQVTRTASRHGVTQIPEYDAIPQSGHEAGDFILLRSG